jgi:hypothetical protein
MKRILHRTLVNVLAAVALGSLISGCGTLAENNAEIAKSQKEMLLTEAGFRARAVTNAKQEARVNQLAPNRVSAVKYLGKLYYVYPSGKKDQIYVGNEAQFDAYKQALEGVRTHLQPQQNAQMAQGLPIWVDETAGPNHVDVQTFDGFGSLDPIPGN